MMLLPGHSDGDQGAAPAQQHQAAARGPGSPLKKSSPQQQQQHQQGPPQLSAGTGWGPVSGHHMPLLTQVGLDARYNICGSFCGSIFFWWTNPVPASVLSVLMLRHYVQEHRQHQLGKMLPAAACMVAYSSEFKLGVSSADQHNYIEGG